MLCEKCGKAEATTHIRSVVNGKVSEIHLCNSCITKLGDIGSKKITNSQIIRCSCCGSSFDEIAKNGKCGCSECYNTFYEQFLPYVEKAQFNRVKHIGKIPNMTVSSQNADKESIEDLQILLNKCIATEQYEQAAVIRDKIKCLKGEKL